MPRCAREARSDLEHAAQNIGIPKALVARARESRMIGDRALDRQPEELAVGHFDMKFRTVLALGVDGEDLAGQQHAQHQFGIDRRPTRVVVASSARTQFKPRTASSLRTK